jgi:tRNA splicing ligase
MTPEQHAQRVRQIAFQLEKADYGMGMPRDYERVCELRIELIRAIKDHANALIATEAQT